MRLSGNVHVLSLMGFVSSGSENVENMIMMYLAMEFGQQVAIKNYYNSFFLGA